MSGRQLVVLLLVILIVSGCGSDRQKADKNADGNTAELKTSDSASGQSQAGLEEKADTDNQPGTDEELDTQLKINRETLLKGSTDQIRVDAARVLLFSEAPQARRILLDALKQSENKAARVAICKVLNQAKGGQIPIRRKDDFAQPLLEILKTEMPNEAKLAAEATLLFDFKEISSRLEKIVTDRSLPANARVNAIYALKLHPDMEAIFLLIDLLDEPEQRVSAEAESVLRTMGIPIGKNPETRKQIKSELRRKGKDEFLQDWLVRQETEMRNIETELALWQQLYLSALDSLYDKIGDDTAKAKFLAKHLVSSKAVVKLWAVEKVYQWRVGSNPKLPAELGPIFAGLISDEDRDVRLRTARVLSLMGELGSAEKLLERFEIEQDDEVKTELFVALGGACYYALMPGSTISNPPGLRKRTLEWAVRYLSDQEPAKAQKGAEVMKKLLEQEGLTSEEVDRYLGLLAERYSLQKTKAGGTLRGELLGAMAGLCAQSVYKTECGKLFWPLFEEALTDDTDLVRESAVDGLIYINKTKALQILRKNHINDSSIVVRKKTIELADKVGSKEDLAWLAEKIETKTEGEIAWQAMLKIFNGSDFAVINEWLTKFESPEFKDRLSDEQRVSFLEIAERKAVSENKSEMLTIVRKKLADSYIRIGQLERSAECLGMLLKDAKTAEEKGIIRASLLRVYLTGGNVQAAKQLLANYLLEKDLEPNDVIISPINDYISKPPSGTDPNAVLEALAAIKTPEPRPMWQELVKSWVLHSGQGQEPDKSTNSNN